MERFSLSSSPSPDAAVLLVEDDPAVAEVVAVALARHGYRVHRVATGSAAIDSVTLDEPDIVVLDLGLPDIDGIEVCRRLRRWTRHPIVVLSADGSEDRKVAALDEGADDYVTKPFSMPELLARLRVAERHRLLVSQLVDESVIAVGDVLIDTAGRLITIRGEVCEVTRKEFDLLALLARNAGKVLTHGVLLTHIWGGTGGGRDSLRVHIAQLRRKLGTGPDRPLILSEPATGYRLLVPDGSADGSASVQPADAER